MTRKCQVRLPWQSAVTKLMLVVVSTGIGLLLVEVLLRTCVEQETKRLAVYDAELGWRGRPNGRGVYVRRKDGIRVPFHYNTLGFRDEDIVEKTPESLRIAMLGDSILESLEVPYDQIFHELVEQRMQDRVGQSTDVVALSSQGYSGAQELLAYRRYSDLMQADIVLSIFYSGNDLDDNLRPRFAYLDDSGTLCFPVNQDSSVRTQYLTLKRWLYEESHVVFLLKNFVESRTNLRLSAVSKAISARDDEYKRDMTAKLLAETQSDVEAGLAKYAVVIIPSRDEILEHAFERTLFVADECEAQGIPCLNLGQYLSLQHYFSTDVHLNTLGHLEVADRIFEFLTSTFDTRFGAGGPLRHTRTEIAAPDGQIR